MINVGLGTLVLGTRIQSLRSGSGKRLQTILNSQYTIENLVEMTNSEISIVTGVEETACNELYQETTSDLTT